MRTVSNHNKNYEQDDCMRILLQPLEGKTMTFTAIFEKYGRMIDGRKTMLVSSVKDSNGLPITHHVWIRELHQIKYSEFIPGDILIFQATVERYVKGYKGYKIEERLKNPPKINYGLTCPKNILRLSPSMC